MRSAGIRLVKPHEIWPIEKLKPYERNSRTHSDEQVEDIGGSFEAFGMNDPIAVHRELGIVEGEGRYRAAMELGMTHLPVLSLNHLTRDQARAYLIAHNKLAEKAGWDKEILSRELRDLEDTIKAAGTLVVPPLPPLPKLGFSNFELGILLPKGEIKKEPEREVERIPKLKKTMTCPGCGLAFTSA